MAKVIFEFDEDEDRGDIDIIVNRHRLRYAIEALNDLYRQIYNGKIYDPNDCIYLKADGCKATQKDYDEANLKGEFLSGGENYIKQKYLELEIDEILDPVRRFLY